MCLESRRGQSLERASARGEGVERQCCASVFMENYRQRQREGTELLNIMGLQGCGRGAESGLRVWAH